MNKNRRQSYHFQLSCGFQYLVNSGIILRFCSIQSFRFPNKTPITLVIGIFKLSTSRQISTFGQKGFTPVSQVPISPDGRARPINLDVSIPILVPSILGSQVKGCVRQFCKIFIFNQMIALQKLWKMFLISSKKLFSFSRCSSFCIFVFSLFIPCQSILYRLIHDKS